MSEEKNRWFIDINPSERVRCCYNCTHFHLWGTCMGYCEVNGKNKISTDCCRKDFERKKGERDEEET